MPCASPSSQELKFEKVQHKVLTADPQPTASDSGNLLVLVTGQLLIDDSPAPMPYSQMFQVGRPHGIRYRGIG